MGSPDTVSFDEAMGTAPVGSNSSKLDLSKYKVSTGDPSADTKNWGKRQDGSDKGQGFLGLLKRPDGKVSSEISIGIEINGKEIEIPTLVPTLSQKEVDYLLNNPVDDPKKLPNSIKQKAVAYAKERIAQGKDPFAGKDDYPKAAPSDVVSFDEAMGTVQKPAEKPVPRKRIDRNPELTEFMQSSGKAIGDYEHQSLQHPYDAAKGLLKATISGVGDIEDLVVQGLTGLANDINSGHMDKQAFAKGQQGAKDFRTSAQHIFSKIMDLNMAPEGKAEQAASDLLGILGNAPHAAGSTVFEDTGSAFLGATAEGASSALLLFSPSHLAKMFKRGIDPAHAAPEGPPPSGGRSDPDSAATPPSTETGSLGAHVAEKFNELAMTDPATADKIADRVSKADPGLGQKMKMRVKMKTSHAKTGLEEEAQIQGRDSAAASVEQSPQATKESWVTSLYDKETGKLLDSFSFFNKDSAEDSAKMWSPDKYITKVEPADKLTESTSEDTWLKDSKDPSKPLVVYRGVIGSAKEGIPEGALKGKPRENYSVFSSTDPHVANTYGTPAEDRNLTGAIVPMHIAADKVIEFPTKTHTFKDGTEYKTFDKFEFDRQASRLKPGEALVVRDVTDMGPWHSPDKEHQRLSSFGSDIYAIGKGTKTRSAVGNIEEAHASVDSPMNDLWGNLQTRHAESFKKGDSLSGKTILDKFSRSIPQGKDVSSKALYQGELIKRLMKAVGNVPVKFVDKLDYVLDRGDGKKVREKVNGLYHPNHTIEVVINGKTVETLMHEFTHAGTIRFMRDNPDHELTKEMNRLFGVAKERLARSGEEAPYGMANVEEFVAEAMSSKHFQEWLIRSERWSGMDEGLGIWNKFAYLIQRMLGLSAKAAPLLHGVLHNTGEIFSARAEQIAHPQPNLVSAGMKEATKGANAAWGPPEEPVKKNIALGKIQEYARQITSVLNPRAVGRGAQVAATYVMSGYAEAMQKAIQLGKESVKREAAWNKRLDSVRDFFKGYESGKTFTDPFMREMQERYIKWNDDILAQDHRNGITYEAQEHYLYHAFKSGPKIPVEQFFRQKYGVKWADPGFTKERGFEMYEAAIKAGYEPKYTNPEQLMQARQYASDTAEMRVNLLKNLEHAGYAVKVSDFKDPPKGYGASQRRSPDGTLYWIHPDSEVIMHNAFDTASLWSAKGIVGDAYRTMMEIKNTIVPTRLAGLFHVNHVGLGIDSATAVARGLKEVLTGNNPLTAIARVIKSGTPLLSSFIINPLRGGRLRALYRGEIKPGDMTLADRDFLRNALDGGFVPYMDRRWLTSASAKFKEAIAKHNYGRAGLRLVPHLISMVNKPIFEMWIPALKAASYEQEMGTLFRVKPELLKPENDVERRVALSKLSIHIDERFGEMATNNMFWPKWLKDIMVLDTLSIGWQKGFLSQFGGGALEAAGAMVHPIEKLKGGDLDRALFATAYTGIALGMTGLMSYGLSGKPPEGEDYIWPRNGQMNADGTPQRVGTVFFTREFGSLYKHTQLEGVFKALKDIAASKGSGLAGLVASAATGRDELNRDIRSNDAPWYQKLEQTAAYMIGDIEPISMEKSGQTPRDKALSIMGSTPAPKYASEPYAESKIKQIYYTYHAPGETSYEKAQQSADAKEYLQLRQDRDGSASEKLSEMREKYKMTSGQIKSLSRAGSLNEPIDIYMFKQLTWQEQVRVLKDSSTSEEDKEKYLRKARTQTKKELEE